MLLVSCVMMLGWRLALADTVPTLFSSFAGNVNFAGTAQTLRTQADGGDSCAVTASTTTASLSGIPTGATVNAAYLYWAASSTDITTAPDYTITFEGSAVSAATGRRYTATYNNSGTNLYYFSGVADVTTVVSAKGNGSYSFTGLSVNTGTPHCAVSGVVAGWALLVIYSHASEDLRVLNIFEGFQAFRGSSVTLTPSNFRIPASPINGKHAYITWEGDVGNSDPLNGFSEGLTFNGSVLSDASNPPTNQFNSVSTITNPVSAASYGVDFDTFDISSHLTAGETSATSVYSSGGDLVLLSAEVISVTNTPVADLGIAKTRNTSLSPGQSATYNLSVTNYGPNAETGPITVTDTLPAGLSYSSFSGSGWSCGAAGQVVTCTRTGSLASNASSTVTMTVAVAANATGTKTNTATVAGTAFDNVSGNNSSTDSYTIAADLTIAMARAAALTPGSNATYTITVSNDGPSSEPGTITVTDILPAGLSYVSGTGTGWSCNAVSQTVTCTRSGSLASAASAPTLTLTVLVAANASGAITNSATVSSTSGMDTNAANNTASDSYIFSAYASYAMDESSWGAGATVLDSSGNGRNATKLSSAAPTGYPPTSPPSSALSGTPGTCGSAFIPSAAGNGVSLPIDVNSIGNIGTIAFWYNSNAAWNDVNNRMLFDASNELGGDSADKHFYLVKESGGRLRFAFENNSDTDYQARSAINAFAANTWHHIAVTWNMGSTATLYLDGAAVASSAVTAGTLGDMATLYLGARRNAVGGTPGNFTSNSANGYIDEVYLYNTALTATGVAGLMSLRHACTASVNHYELSMPSSSITCLPTTVTITACADTSSPCTNNYTGVSGQTAVVTATGGGTLATNTVTFNASGVASTTLSYPSAADGTSVSVALSSEQSLATSSRQCCPNGTSCSVASSCSTTFNRAGFIFSGSAGGSVATIPTQVAGTSSSTYYLRAVKTSDATKACETALSGLQTVSFAYECNNPVACYTSNLMSVNGGSSTPIARNDNNSVSSYLPVAMTFDANGNAPFTFNYSDVGQVTLRVSKTVNNAMLTGSSNAFVVKPFGFSLTNIKRSSDNFDNPTAADAAGASFVKAGENFSATVTALTSTGSNAYNYGKESVPEGVKLTPALVTGLGLTNNPAIGGSFGTFGDGVATGTGFTWNEVGVITLTPSVAPKSPAVVGNYLGAGDVTGTTTGNVGRFYAAKFKLSNNVIFNRSDVCPSDVGAGCPSTFTYIGEPLTASFTLTATAVDGTTKLQNYSWSATASQQFGKLDPTAVPAGSSGPFVLGAVDSAATRTPFSPCGASPAHPCVTPGTGSGLFANGTADITLPMTVFRRATAVAPFASLDFGIAPMDSDGVLMDSYDLDTVNAIAGTNNHAKVGRAVLRYGRVKLSNATGSELLPLPVPVKAEYYNGGFGFVTNADDNSTAFTLSPSTDNAPTSFQYGSLLIDTPQLNMTVGASTPTFTTSPLSDGQSNIRLSAPAPSLRGSIYLTLTVPAWLQYPWPSGSNPRARATFGVYRGNNDFIYLRENY